MVIICVIATTIWEKLLLNFAPSLRCYVNYQVLYLKTELARQNMCRVENSGLVSIM
jgi:hypothetical protein